MLTISASVLSGMNAASRPTATRGDDGDAGRGAELRVHRADLRRQQPVAAQREADATHRDDVDEDHRGQARDRGDVDQHAGPVEPDLRERVGDRRARR